MYRVHAWYKESVLPVSYMCVCTDGFGFGKQHTYKTLRYFSNIIFKILYRFYLAYYTCNAMSWYISYLRVFVFVYNNRTIHYSSNKLFKLSSSSNAMELSPKFRLGALMLRCGDLGCGPNVLLKSVPSNSTSCNSLINST